MQVVLSQTTLDADKSCSAVKIANGGGQGSEDLKFNSTVTLVHRKYVYIRVLFFVIELGCFSK